MALKAIVDGKVMRAPFIELDAWRAIQANKPEIRMICCDGQGYMRVREKRQEFVHYRRSEECIGRPDSPEHDYLKTVVMRAVEQSGWEADVEVIDPKRRWIADVLATRNEARLAFEIQLSPITYDDLLRRYSLYKRSRVRSCWFVKGRLGRTFIEEPSSDMPVFVLERDDDAEPGSQRFSVSISPDHRYPIKDAVCALLNHQFRWCRARRARRVENIVLLRMENCWFCRKPFGMYRIEGIETQCGEAPRSTFPRDRRLLEPAVLEALESYITAHPEIDVAISYPCRLPDPITGIADVGFTCSHCDGVLGFRHHQWVWSRAALPIATIPLASEVSQFEDPHWCYSRKQDFCC